VNGSAASDFGAAVARAKEASTPASRVLNASSVAIVAAGEELAHTVELSAETAVRSVCPQVTGRVGARLP
jgi:hypothetical protein